VGRLSYVYTLTDEGEAALDNDGEEDDDDDEHSVFLVHGRDRETMREVQSFVGGRFRGEVDVKVLIDLPDRGSETVYSKLTPAERPN